MSSAWLGNGGRFPHGWVEEIRMERDTMEVRAFGEDRRSQFVQGLTHVTMRLRLNDGAAVDAVLRALGASDRQVAEAVEVIRRGQREVSL